MQFHVLAKDHERRQNETGVAPIFGGEASITTPPVHTTAVRPFSWHGILYRSMSHGDFAVRLQVEHGLGR
jgi:hypothetical protein